MTLEALTSDILSPLRHGFFTRSGGASSGIFSGLNCGTGSSDQVEIVALNRSRVAQAMEVDPQNLLSLYQTHSPDVITLSAPWQKGERPKADGMATATSGIALGILTADCAPVLFADPKNGVIGACHAGWKGALSGVLQATMDAMIELGAARETIQASIGPCISQRAYEVGPEFLDQFIEQDPKFSRFFANSIKGKYLFDLPSFVLDRLRSAGVGNADWIGHCTYTDPIRFFSYRRATHNQEPDYGRLISAICL